MINPCAELAKAGWKFDCYEGPDSWSVWAKHPLGGGCMIAELPIIGRTGFDVKATAEYIVWALSQHEDAEQFTLGPSEFQPKRIEDCGDPLP